MSQLPKFLLGGIQFRRNFIGANTIKTSVYGVLECSVKIVPLFLIIGLAGMIEATFLIYSLGHNYTPSRQVLVEGAVASAPVRRQSLTE